MAIKTGIKTNGNHIFKKAKKSGAVSAKAYGTFGGASVQIGFIDDNGTYVLFSDNNAAKTGPGEWKISAGYDVELFLSVTGASGTTDITVSSEDVV